MTYRKRRQRMTREERQAMEREALSRAVSSPSWANFGQVIEEFSARGIPAAAISPKENVFTYHAWRALGRQVRKGEHGVKILSYAVIEPSKRDREEAARAGKEAETRRRPVTAVVFHISQTDAIDGRQQAAAAPAAAAAEFGELAALPDLLAPDDCGDCGRPLNEFGACSSADVGAPCAALVGPIDSGTIVGELIIDAPAVRVTDVW